MISPELFSYPNNPELAAQKAGQKLFTLVNKFLKKDHPVLLLLSGGSWISALDKADSSELLASPNLNQLTLTTLDERAEIGPDNNFGKILTSLNIQSLIKSGVNTLATIPFNYESAGTFGERIDVVLKDYLSKHPDAVLIATTGVGGINNTLGHIAGIEPMEDKSIFNHAFLKPNIFYLGYMARKLKPDLRATATFLLLDKVDHFVLLILNPEEKRQSLDLILSEDQKSLNEAPCIYFRNRPNTTIYTDISKKIESDSLQKDTLQ